MKSTTYGAPVPPPPSSDLSFAVIRSFVAQETDGIDRPPVDNNDWEQDENREDQSSVPRIVQVQRLCSAQHAVLLLSIRAGDKTSPTTSEETTGGGSPFHKALCNGNHRLIVRVWRGSARWWDLHRSHSRACDATLLLARAEVSGYRLAQWAFQLREKVRQQRRVESSNDSRRGGPDDVAHISHSVASLRMENDLSLIRIPDLLHFSRDWKTETTTKETSEEPWAIFSYVGRDSCLFSSRSFAAQAETQNGGNNNKDEKQQSALSGEIVHESWILDEDNEDYLLPQMVKVRHEFGFMEPHPRHGRVRVEDSLDYAMEVLQSVVLPIHLAFFRWHATRNTSPDLELVETSLRWLGPRQDATVEQQFSEPFTYHHMIAIYERAIDELMEAQKRNCEGAQSDETSSADSSNDNGSHRMQTTVDVLRRCLEELKRESESDSLRQVLRLASSSSASTKSQLRPVLCHMDLQPQNMILRRRRRRPGTGEEPGGTKDDNTLLNAKGKIVPQIASVLDWEEAAFADPRFEILLLGRKVCANMEQAQTIWRFYGCKIQELTENAQLDIGPLEPWLKLETVHSLCTLALQALDLAGGGRNPWERNPDLWGKMERELQRLVSLGWTFCRIEVGI